MPSLSEMMTNLFNADGPQSKNQSIEKTNKSLKNSKKKKDS